MDWMRRNWPDLLIGLALLAVIAGIIATLLSGGSLLPLGRSGVDTQAGGFTDSSSRVVTPVVPDRPSEGRPGSDSVEDDTQVAQTDNPGSRTDEGATGGEEIVPVLPDITGGPEAGPASPTPDAADRDDGASQQAEAVDDPAPAGTGSFSVAPRNQAPFRVSAGAFGVQDYAEAQVERLSEAGYPVFTGRQGDLYLVLVGPYADEGEAQQIAAELGSEGLVQGPIVYECEDCGIESSTEEGGGDASLSTSADALGDGTDDAEEEAVTSAPTAGGGESGETYLQVGAYPTLESSEVQRERMQELGYTVTVREEGGLVKLLIGPFGDDDLEAAQARLDGQGIDNFPRR